MSLMPIVSMSRLPILQAIHPSTWKMSPMCRVWSKTTGPLIQIMPFNKFVIVTTQEHLDVQIPKLDPDFKDQYAVFKSRSFFLEVMKKGVSKGDTLAKLGELLDISPQEMMTMGDQENDLVYD